VVSRFLAFCVASHLPIQKKERETEGDRRFDSY
jgi:hypothetical protein